MLFKFKPEIPSSEITDEKLYNHRRQFLKAGALATIGGSLMPSSVLAAGRATFFKGPDDLTPYEVVTSYNNFYEFGTGKDEPKVKAARFKTDPWTVSIEGEVEKPKVWDLDELIDGFTTQEKVYRHRCVEGWSMVVPWNGFPLKDLITRLKPTSKAKFVEFTTLHDSRRMPGQLSQVLDWPYVEALRLDEAMNPLTLMVTGVYGKMLPPQNGAPIRLIIPWKYGFKGGKSIVKIRFTEKQPKTTWSQAIPREYGFYANVNPKVDHPRWTQAKERRLGEFTRRDTLMFNGYTAEVEKLYAGMDLRKNY